MTRILPWLERLVCLNPGVLGSLSRGRETGPLPQWAWGCGEADGSCRSLPLCRIRRVGRIVDLAERDALRRGDPCTVVIFGAEGGRTILEPAELTPDRTEPRLDLDALSLQLVAADRVAPDAESSRLAEYDLFQGRNPGFVAEHAHHHRGPVLLHLDGGHKGIERTPFHQLDHGVADHLAGKVVEIGLEHPDPVAGGRKLGAAQEQPQDVGLLRQVAAAGARPMLSMVIAGSGPNRSTTVVRIAAPVGVVNSISTIDSASGTPLSISAVAGAGSAVRPWAALIQPFPGGTGLASKQSTPSRSRPTADPTMSMIESTAPTS